MFGNLLLEQHLSLTKRSYLRSLMNPVSGEGSLEILDNLQEHNMDNYKTAGYGGVITWGAGCGSCSRLSIGFTDLSPAGKSELIHSATHTDNLLELLEKYAVANCSDLNV